MRWRLALVGAMVVALTAVAITVVASARDAERQVPRVADNDGAGSESGPPYGVGVLTTTLVDSSRPTPPRGDVPGAPTRTLRVTIRYPTAAATPREVGDAPPLREQFPLVVFVHGYAGAADLYAELLRELTAAGFVVAAPDFPLSSVAVPGAPIRDPVEQAADVSFVIDALQRRDSAPNLLGPIGRRNAVGVAGQSDGGVTAAGVAYNDEYADTRIGGAAILTGAQIFFPGTWFTRASPPFLAVHGDADEMNPFEASERLYAATRSPKWLVRVVGGGHLDPFTVDPVRPEIGALIADFFRASLLHDANASARMAHATTGSARLEVLAHE